MRRLALRPRTRAELEGALRDHAVDTVVVREILDRYDEVGLIDDEAFALAWVTSRHHGKGLARRALARELRNKGVADETVGQALAVVDDATEATTARALVSRKLRTIRDDRSDAVFRRLVGMLARKGYAPGLAIEVVREAMAGRPGVDDIADGIDNDA